MKPRKPSGFLGQIRRDKWLIIFCLALAFIGWQGIRKTIGFEVSVSNIAVDLKVPEGWAVWENSVNKVNILFRGSRENIRYLNNEQLKVIIPVSDPKHGEEMIINLSDIYLKNPTDAKAVSFNPAQIVVRLDQESKKTLPVKASVGGILSEGLEVERIVCTPATVQVSGARQVLDEMDNIHTVSIDLKDRQTSFKESVAIALPQAGRMNVSPQWVSVEVFLEAHSSTEVFENIPIRTLCSPGEQRHITIVPQTINITVSGQQQRIEQLRSTELFAYVNCTDLTESTGYDMPVSVNLPAGIQQIKTDPTVVHIEIGNPL